MAVILLNTFLMNQIQLRYLPPIKQFGLPVSVSCPVCTNDHRVSPFGIGLKGMRISFEGLD